jgi:hypothetical protein
VVDLLGICLTCNAISVNSIVSLSFTRICIFQESRSKLLFSRCRRVTFDKCIRNIKKILPLHILCCYVTLALRCTKSVLSLRFMMLVMMMIKCVSYMYIHL